MSRPASPDDDGLTRDPWLSEALRHAPDADAAPPSALSEIILRQARAAATAVPPASRGAPSVGQRLLAGWSWLARPPVAAGFASLMVLTVTGLMWWDRPLEDALPPRESPVVAAAPAAAPPTPPTPPTPATATATAEAPAAAFEEKRQAAPRVEPPTVPARTTAPRPGLQRSPPARPAQMPTAPAVASNDAVAEAAPMQAPAPVAAPPAPAATPPAAPPQDTRSVAAGAAAGATAGALADAESGTPRMELARERGAAAKSAAPALRAAAPQALRRDLAGNALPLAPLAPLRASIAAEPQRWRWQHDEAAARPMDTAFMQWLARLDEATRAGWLPEAELAPAGAAQSEAAPAATLRLWLDGRLHSTLRLGAGAAEFEAAGQPASRQRSDLPAATASALKAALDQAGR